MADERRRRGSLLGIVAYILVPGERRVRAARHFGKAGFETLKGFRELVGPERPPNSSGAESREHIEIE